MKEMLGKYRGSEFGGIRFCGEFSSGFGRVIMGSFEADDFRFG